MYKINFLLLLLLSVLDGIYAQQKPMGGVKMLNYGEQ